MNSLFPVTLVCIKAYVLVSEMRKITIVQNFFSNTNALGFHQEHKEIHACLGKCVFSVVYEDTILVGLWKMIF